MDEEKNPPCKYLSLSTEYHLFPLKALLIDSVSSLQQTKTVVFMSIVFTSSIGIQKFYSMTLLLHISVLAPFARLQTLGGRNDIFLIPAPPQYVNQDMYKGTTWYLNVFEVGLTL